MEVRRVDLANGALRTSTKFFAKNLCTLFPGYRYQEIIVQLLTEQNVIFLYNKIINSFYCWKKLLINSCIIALV